MKKHPLRYGAICVLAVCLFFLLNGISSCTSNTPPVVSGVPFNNPDSITQRWFDFNVSFEQGVNSTTRALYLAQIRKFIVDSSLQGAPNAADFKVDTSSIQLDSCSCDSSFYNYSATLIQTSGPSGSTPPVKSPGPSGGEGIFNFSKNNKMTVNNKNAVTPEHVVVSIQPKIISDSVLLAIIDSGIDSTLFEQPGISKILWPGSGNLPNQRNFSLEGAPGDMSDRTKVRHGSAVAAIALEQFMKTGIYPRLMILKVFDSTESTRSFSVGCAMKYAIDHHASIINASWGYYGTIADPVLQHYINLAEHVYTNRPIPIIAAAGNDTLHKHDPRMYCDDHMLANTRLTERNLFFPACFSRQDANVISITGLNDDTIPCYYQNYSPEFITLGVKNLPNANKGCCLYKPAYLQHTNFIMEGTSFATPVVTGKIAWLMLQYGIKKNIDDYMVGLHPKTVPGGTGVTIGTKQGKYIEY